MTNDIASFDLQIEYIASAVALHDATRDRPSPAEFQGRVERLAAAEEHRTAGYDENIRVRLGLSPDEAQVIWLLAARAVDLETRERLMDPSRPQIQDPSLDTIRSVLWGRRHTRSSVVFERRGLLRRLGIIDRTDGGYDGLHGGQTWTLNTRVLRWLEEFEAVGAVDVAGSRLPPVVSATVTDGLRSALASERAVVVVAGSRGTGRRSALQSMKCNLISFDCERKAKNTQDAEAELRSLALECRLTGKVPLLCNLDALAEEKGERLAVVANEFAPLIEGNILVTCGVQRPNVTWDRPVIVIEMGQPTHEQRAQLWHEALGQGTKEDAVRLANQYPLAPALIVRAAEAANARAAERDLAPEDIYAGIRAVLDDRLGMYARRLTITQTWEDIVLPADQGDAVVELIARVRGRHKVYEQWGFGAKVGKGLGVSALFSGPPGTGKTMVAGLIAKELGLELYQVDTAKVVSKYIGETEKNLAALFDAAEAGHAILLFDEADSLFGKRTDVKSSNDRFANLETNYLLQRLETFTGICLLTSNHESNMDPAFQRRLSLHLRFELPDVDERALLWRAVLPADAPVTPGVDFLGLARRFAMSGGYIKNAALRAAFIAADQGQPITAAHLERAARVEYEGMGKIAA